MMIGFCQFLERTQAGLWRCVQCGYVYKLPADEPPRRNCPNAPDLRPAAERLAEETGDRTILNKMAHYMLALGQWAASGFETRTPEEVKQIYQEHCEPCPQRDVTADACGICGCNVRAQGIAVKNMIAMATLSCPLEKW